MTDKEEKIKSPRFAFLKISDYAHCTHLQSRSSQFATQALQKSAILSAHLTPFNTSSIYQYHF
jgi:hypothetical protein